MRTGSIEVVITNEKMTAQKSGTSAAAAAAAFSMADRIRRPWDALGVGATPGGTGVLKYEAWGFLGPLWGETPDDLNH